MRVFLLLSEISPIAPLTCHLLGKIHPGQETACAAASLELLWDSLASSSSVLSVCLVSVQGGTDPSLLPES